MAEPVPTDPFALLLVAHDDFVEKLSELEAVLDEMTSARSASEGNLEFVDETIRFFEEDLLPHFRIEDEVVLGPLEAKLGRFGSLVNVIEYEHEEIRREVAKFKEARSGLADAGDPWPAIEELNRHGIFTIQFLWDHFRKEKVSLFPTARENLTQDQLEAVRARLAA